MSLIDSFPETRPAFPITSWDNVPSDIERAEIRGNVVKDFAPLLGLRNLRTLEATPHAPAQLDVLGRLRGLEVLALDHLGRGLETIGRLAGLRALKLFAFSAAGLAGVEGLESLHYLQIDHAPKITSLAPLRHLKRLEWLLISTPPSWDASRKTIKVESLDPLSGLTALRFLGLRGVEPQAGGLAPIAPLKQLQELTFSHVFTLGMEDYARLAAALPSTEGDCLQPTYRLNVRFACKTCRETDVVWLTGPAPRAKRSLCPKCDAKKLAEHIAAFERIKALAAA